MQVFRGIVGNPGLVMAPMVRMGRTVDASYRMVLSPEAENEALNKAIGQAVKELNTLERRANSDEADIFLFQRMLLEDASLRREIDDYIQAGAGAAAAVERAGKLFAAKLSSLDDPYLSQRSADVLDASHRVVDILDGRPRKQVVLTEPSILVADHFFPSDILSFGRGMVLGFVAARGSTQSHAAIIAAALGLPTLVQCGSGVMDCPDGATAVLDAENGVFIVEPMKESMPDILRRLHEKRQTKPLPPELLAPCRTADGTRVEVMANCMDPESIEEALAKGAEGVALLRTESLCQQGVLASEEQQYYYFLSCIAAAKGKPLTIRCLDLSLSMLTPGARIEPNPALGMRGIRLLLGRPALFENHLCALLRASAKGNISLLMPMVSSVKDWKLCLAAVERAKDNLRRRGVAFDENIKVGVLVETPGAALECGAIVEAGAQLVCIGTNDLVQYVSAADRYEQAMASYYDTHTNAMRRLLKIVVEDVADRVPLSVVGVPITDPGTSEFCARIGIHRLGLPGPSIPEIKRHLMQVDMTVVPDHHEVWEPWIKK